MPLDRETAIELYQDYQDYQDARAKAMRQAKSRGVMDYPGDVFRALEYIADEEITLREGVTVKQAQLKLLEWNGFTPDPAADSDDYRDEMRQILVDIGVANPNCWDCGEPVEQKDICPLSNEAAGEIYHMDECCPCENEHEEAKEE